MMRDLTTQQARLAEIADIADFAEGITAPLSTAPIAEAVARLARLIEAEMAANDPSGVLIRSPKRSTLPTRHLIDTFAAGYEQAQDVQS